MECPRCHTSLTGVDYQGVHIETCPACGGDWLDAGELKSIVKSQYGPKLRQIEADVDKEEQVHISHVHLINAAINGIFDFFDR
ncbi:MAG TPA: zf-TFIIB domain-containing protein [Tepidisphaeraceae bacterium]|jgi:Zn-finger nucleic acid-binding protein